MLHVEGAGLEVLANTTDTMPVMSTTTSTSRQLSSEADLSSSNGSPCGEDIWT